MEQFGGLISKLAGNYWNVYTISLLLGTGFLLTILTRFIQIRRFAAGWRLILKGAVRKDESGEQTGDISPFQALMTSLSATVGNGNIAGVATAIVSGGPGAVFWMWMTAIVGMATKYSEAVLAVHYRRVAADGSMAGGPMHYISRGLAEVHFLRYLAGPLAGLFAFFGAWTALFGTGNMMQANSMALAFKEQLNIPFWLTGAVVAVLTALVILGGIKRIGATTEILVPFMILLYFGGALLILALNIGAIPAIFRWIVASAFTPQAAVGGFVGHSVRMAVQYGVRRGLLSNESGLGSTPIAHAASKARNPVTQGLIAMFDTFIDTIVVCSCTAFVILATGAHLPENNAVGVQLTSSALTAHAFSMQLGKAGGVIVSASSALFGYSTLIGWYYYGERCFEYLFGLRAIRYYKAIYVLLTFAGALLQGERLQIVWELGDLSNGLMALPNLVGLLFLARTVKRVTDRHLRDLDV